MDGTTYLLAGVELGVADSAVVRQGGVGRHVSAGEDHHDGHEEDGDDEDVHDDDCDDEDSNVAQNLSPPCFVSSALHILAG